MGKAKGKGKEKGKRNNNNQSAPQNYESTENARDKTTKCRNWHGSEAPGTCKYGDACKFRHGDIE